MALFYEKFLVNFVIVCALNWVSPSLNLRLDQIHKSFQMKIFKQFMKHLPSGGPQSKINDVLEGILVKAVIWPLRSHVTKVLHEHDELEAEKLKNSMTVALSKPHEELGKFYITLFLF